MSYPERWAIQDMIDRSTNQKAEKHEVHSLDSRVDSLEHSLRGARADIDGVRGQLEAAQNLLISMTDLLQRIEERESDLGEREVVSKSEQKRIDALKGDDTAPIALLLKRLRGQRVDSETADPEGLMLVAADEIERLARVNQLAIQGSRWQHIDDARELTVLRVRVAELEAGQDEAKGFIEGLDVQNNALRKRAGEADIEQRAELVAWCGQVSEDVHTRLDGTWPNDPLLTRCSIAFGRLFAEIDRLEREARASKSGEAAP
jgi:hypothetical protein